MPTAVAWLVLLATSAAPGLRDEPPNKGKPPKKAQPLTEPIVVSGITDAVLTVPGRTALKYELVKSPAGARIRVKFWGPGSDVFAILEATRVRLRVQMKDGRIELVTVQVAADGKSLDVHTQDEPAAKRP